MKKVRWGILSTAKIARDKVIPAMQSKAHCEVTAIASRDIMNAKAVANTLGIPKSYGSYEALLNDPDIDAVYNPLPNNMHLEWAVKIMQAGKHLLTEKPLALNLSEARQLVDEASRHPKLKVMEAFMYRHHAQWQYAKKTVAAGGIGPVKTIQSFFSYHNIDPANIRNRPETGGGALLDIGCYCISLARFLTDKEPTRVFGMMEKDDKMKTDCIISGILDFGDQTSTFTSSTQVTPYQRVQIIGTTGRIEIEIPFNAPTEVPCRVWLHQGDDTQEIKLEVCNQYEMQGKLFCNAIMNDTPVPTPLEDGLQNMKVIEAFKKSAAEGTWANI